MAAKSKWDIHPDAYALRDWVQREIRLRRDQGDNVFGGKTLVECVSEASGINLHHSNANTWVSSPLKKWIQPDTQRAIAKYMIKEYGKIEQWLWRNMPPFLQREFKKHEPIEADPPITISPNQTTLERAIIAIGQATEADKPAIGKLLQAIAGYLLREDENEENTEEDEELKVFPESAIVLGQILKKHYAVVADKIGIPADRLKELCDGTGRQLQVDELKKIFRFWDDQEKDSGKVNQLMLDVLEHGLCPNARD